MKEIKDMTLREKIGQLVFAGFPGYEYDEHLKKLVEEYKLGNIILFTRNVKNIKQLHDLNYKIHEEIKKNTGNMPLISIDQEGGIVTRIMEEATFLPGSMSIAATNAHNAYLLGKISGEELRALGINMNLAPSLDVNNNPLNPVIGVRSYSDKPEVVSKYGLEFIKGLQESGIIATAKHFPGHGDTEADSHYSLPVVPHSKERLHMIELAPFKAAIKAGVDSIMSAHVFFTAYEEGNLPGTLSKNVLTNLLREELGFDGLIVSDCMEMKAISDNYTTPKGVLMGLLAGLDMVFVSQTLENQVKSLELVYEAVKDGTFPEALLDEKVERVLKYKKRISKIMEEHFYNVNYEEKEKLVLKVESKELASKVVDNSFTKVRGKDYYPNKKTLVIATEPYATTIAEDQVSKRSIVDMIKANNLEIDSIKINVRPTEEEIKNIVNKAKGYEQVLVFTFNAKFYKSQADLIYELDNYVKDLYVISTRNPYDIHSFNFVENYYCLYEYTPNSVNTVIKFLKGDLKPIGNLPISLDLPISVGASLYVGLDDYPHEKNLEYLKLLKAEGIEKVFISGHMPEVNDSFEKELKEVLEFAKELDLKVILDVSKAMYEKLEIENIYSLRLDFGFSDEDIINLVKEDKFIIELNASTLTKKRLDYLKHNGVDLRKLRVSHNFYPKPETGLAFKKVKETNEMLARYGMEVMGYIPGKTGKRGPLYFGLPTVESHRTKSLEVILQELKLLGFREVVFGDAYIELEELRKAINFDYSIHQIPLKLYDGITELELNQLKKIHRRRMDANELMIRSSTRLSTEVIKPRNTVLRKTLSVTVDNVLYKRYQGEVAIILEDLPANEFVNVVGEVEASSELLAAIKPGDKFKFIIGD